jgi:hypothetical protein
MLTEKANYIQEIAYYMFSKYVGQWSEKIITGTNINYIQCELLMQIWN